MSNTAAEMCWLLLLFYCYYYKGTDQIQVNTFITNSVDVSVCGCRCLAGSLRGVLGGRPVPSVDVSVCGCRCLAGSLCRGVLGGRPVPSPHRLWEHHQLPERHRHQRRRWRADRRQPRQPVPHCRVPARRLAHWRVWMSVREGEPLLWAQDHIGGLRRDAGQKQPARSHSQHTVHRLAGALGSLRSTALFVQPVFSCYFYWTFILPLICTRLIYAVLLRCWVDLLPLLNPPAMLICPSDFLSGL